MAFRLYLRSGHHREDGQTIKHGNTFKSETPWHEKDPARFALVNDDGVIQQPGVQVDVTDEDDEDEEDAQIKELKKMTVAELDKFAEENDIELEDDWNKGEKLNYIIDVVSE